MPKKGQKAPKKWKLELRASSPRRIINRCWTLREELEYYDVSQWDFARFLEVDASSIQRWLKNEPPCPQSVVLLMALLSQFPPLWVRNRLTGLVKIDYALGSNQNQEFFKEGSLSDGDVQEKLARRRRTYARRKYTPRGVRKDLQPGEPDRDPASGAHAVSGNVLPLAGNVSGVAEGVQGGSGGQNERPRGRNYYYRRQYQPKTGEEGGVAGESTAMGGGEVGPGDVR